jgi:hypothetical protein
MSKIKLEFKSPKALNDLKQGEEVAKEIWKYFKIPNSELTIDLENWNIECSENSKKDKITNWLVNEQEHQMQLNDETEIDNFEELSYTFAVSMLGQLVDRVDLIKYLTSLQVAFEIKAKEKTEENKEENPTDNNLNKN